MTKASGEEENGDEDRRGEESRAREEASSSKRKRLFTIGYQQTPPKAVLDELENAGVKLLVDVRAVASSRRPGFSKNQLVGRAEGARHRLPAPAGASARRRKAGSQRAPGDQKALETIYAKHLKTPQAKQEMDELATLIEKAGPVCILCYERDHRECHRRFIAEIIEERDGVAIENLQSRRRL